MYIILWIFNSFILPCFRRLLQSKTLYISFSTSFSVDIAKFLNVEQSLCINISKERTASVYRLYISCRWRQYMPYVMLTSYNMTGSRSLENCNIRYWSDLEMWVDKDLILDYDARNCLGTVTWVASNPADMYSYSSGTLPQHLSGRCVSMSFRVQRNNTQLDGGH